MVILGIETSCDETAAAIVEDGRKILSNVISSSKDLHEKTGGIIPEAAAREQVKCIIPVIKEALKYRTYNIRHLTKYVKNNKVLSVICYLLTDLDAIAVTVGPGLIGSLLVGVETAKTIAYVTGKPIVPVNHIFAHIYANWLNNKVPNFPAIALVVSGGHTELFLMKDHGSLKWLGGTRDDAAGEAFDKTARLLGLGFPGGPAIAAAAVKFKVQSSKFKVRLPRPMIDAENLDFSFSGLKTAVLREINNLKANQHFDKVYPERSREVQGKQLSGETIQYLAYEIQESITDVLVDKTIKAVKQHKVKSILLGGGVAANERLKEKFNSLITNYQLPIILHIPSPHLCTDNAAYIASNAFFNYKPVPWSKIQAQPDLEVEV